MTTNRLLCGHDATRRASNRAAVLLGAPLRRTRRLFTLVEVIIVVVIISILAAIAIPRLSRGAEDADEAAVRRDLSILQRQIELFAAEHNGTYPAAVGDGTNGAGTTEAFLNHMLSFSDIQGRTSTTRTSAYRFGPYLRKGIPALKTGAAKGATGVKVVTSDAPSTDPNTAIGWVYSSATGEIIPNVGGAFLLEGGSGLEVPTGVGGGLMMAEEP